MRQPLKLILIGTLCLCILCGCTGPALPVPEPTTVPTTAPLPQTTEPSEPEVFRLCYSSRDSLNPYKAQSVINLALMPLVYDPLFQIDNSFTAQPVIAESYAMDGLAFAVTLKSGLAFSNGSAVTTADVFASYKLAAQSPVFSSKVKNIEKISIESDAAMTFYLKEADINFVNTLDFPIVNKQTGGEDFPSGSGRYTISGNGENIRLTANNNHSFGFAPPLSDIPLVDIPEGGAVVNALETGRISFLYDELSEGSGKRINAATRSVPMNNLVFLGINTWRSGISNASVRRALSLALNRKDIITNGFQGNALAATGLFHPNWAPAATAQTGEITGNSAQAKQLMEEAGVGSLSLKLLVNEENAFRKDTAAEIVENLAELGVEVTVVTKDWEEYSKAITAGDYDLFIGEVRIASNMDLLPLIAGSRENPTGVICPENVKNNYAEYKSGTLRLEDFLDTFDNAMPFIPICYRNGIVAYSRSLMGEMAPAQGNVFKGIEDWTLFQSK